MWSDTRPPLRGTRRWRAPRWIWLLGSTAMVMVLWWTGGRDSSAKPGPSVLESQAQTQRVVEVIDITEALEAAGLATPAATPNATPNAEAAAPAAPAAAAHTATKVSPAAPDTLPPAAEQASATLALAPVAAPSGSALVPGAHAEPAAGTDAAGAEVTGGEPSPPEEPATGAPREAAASVDTHEISRGDTLGAIFTRLGLDHRAMQSILEVDEELLALDVLRPGQRLSFHRDAQGTLVEMELFIHLGHRIAYLRQDDGSFAFEERLNPGTWRPELVTGPIHGSFYTSARKVGLNDADVAAIAKLFEAQIHFGRDLRAGDTFEVVRNRHFVDGVPTGQTRIEAVRIERRTHTHSAFLHEDGNYYDLKGESLARAFLRHPTTQPYRISSGFNPRRLHPVTRRIAPHNGTDFAMPVGTPVLSTGDGVVVRVGNHPFAGKYVEIQHSGQYKTRYLHLHRIQVKRGQRVARGQRIALSGNTGRSTGPHLHFELHVSGRPVDPMRARIPTAAAVARQDMPAFRSRVDELLAMMAQPERYLAQR